MRLIDADEEAKWASEHILDAKERYGILNFLRDCSTVDAIPVVRCKITNKTFRKIIARERPENIMCGEFEEKSDSEGKKDG